MEFLSGRRASTLRQKREHWPPLRANDLSG